jgi:lipoprotein-anchoring transpeptidase ErfK/SrfK
MPLGHFLVEQSPRGSQMSRRFAYGSLAALIAAATFSCGTAQAQSIYAYVTPPQQFVAPQAKPNYDAMIGDEDAQLPPGLQRQMVDYPSREARGTILIDTPHTYLYLIVGNGKAMRYSIGVGREGFTWSGVRSIVRKAEWPDWYPPADMIKRQPYLPRMTAGGPGNPLGARALYIGGTQYRIHGTNDPSTIGKHVSSGCIRLTNEDVIDLFSRVKVGAKVIVLPQSAAPTREAKARKPAAHDVSSEASPTPVRMTWNAMRQSGLY